MFLSSATEHLVRVFREETRGIRPRLLTLEWRLKFVRGPDADEKRADVYRSFGFSVGPGTRFSGPLGITGIADLFDNLSFGKRCIVATGVTFDALHTLTVGDDVHIGPGVLILTSSHELGPKEHRAGPLVLGPVTIQDGAIIGARTLILPNVTIGAGAVVEPGSLVNKDVRENTRVGGNPAVVLEDMNAAQDGKS